MIRTLPEVGRKMQPMMETSVVLPLPEGPISSITSPLATSRSTRSSARNAEGPSP
jgi:hypothetical protein